MCAILASRKSNEKSHFNSNHSWISPFVLYEFIFLLFKCRLSKLELPNGFFFQNFVGNLLHLVILHKVGWIKSESLEMQQFFVVSRLVQ